MTHLDHFIMTVLIMMGVFGGFVLGGSAALFKIEQQFKKGSNTIAGKKWTYTRTRRAVNDA